MTEMDGIEVVVKVSAGDIGDLINWLEAHGYVQIHEPDDVDLPSREAQ